MSTPDTMELNREAEVDEEEWQDRRVQLNTHYGLESYSVGNMIDRMFEEADANPEIPGEIFSEEEVPEESDRKVMQFLVKDVLTGLRHEKLVREIRLKAKDEGFSALTPVEKKAVFRAYDRLRRESLARTERKYKEKMPDKLASKIRFVTGSDLNYSLRQRIIEGGEPAKAELSFILNPKARKVDLLPAKELLRYLKNSMNRNGDVKFVKRIVDDGTANDETKKAYQEIAKENPEGKE